MAQEWACSPFLFFTDHTDELGRNVTEGRRDEFRSFAAFSDPQRRAEIPDPQAADTFARSKLDWTEPLRAPHRAVRRLYARLLALRQADPAFANRTRESSVARAVDEHTVEVASRDRGLIVVARLSGGQGTVHLDRAGTPTVLLTTEDGVRGRQPPDRRRSESADLHFRRATRGRRDVLVIASSAEPSRCNTAPSPLARG